MTHIGPDGEWDPRVDSGGRHADHPDFGRSGMTAREAAWALIGAAVGIMFAGAPLVSMFLCVAAVLLLAWDKAEEDA